MEKKDLRKMYLSPFTDFGFKKLFSNPKHQGPLRDFITHALAPFGVGEIQEIELLDRDLLPDGPETRGRANYRGNAACGRNIVSQTSDLLHEWGVSQSA